MVLILSQWMIGVVNLIPNSEKSFQLKNFLDGQCQVAVLYFCTGSENYWLFLGPPVYQVRHKKQTIPKVESSVIWVKIPISLTIGLQTDRKYLGTFEKKTELDSAFQIRHNYIDFFPISIKWVCHKLEDLVDKEAYVRSFNGGVLKGSYSELVLSRMSESI